MSSEKSRYKLKKNNEIFIKSSPNKNTLSDLNTTENDSYLSKSLKIDTLTEFLNTDKKTDRILKKLEPLYDDPKALQCLLDETIKVLTQTEQENDELKSKCSMFEKVTNDLIKIIKDYETRIMKYENIKKIDMNKFFEIYFM
jgi:hypothetical protein